MQAGAECTANSLKGHYLPDQAWQDYVTEVGERLLAQSPHAGRTYAFVVVDQPVVNNRRRQMPTSS